MKSNILLILLISSAAVFAQQKTIQEQLGYSKETKLLIIHADDLGVIGNRCLSRRVQVIGDRVIGVCLQGCRY